MFEVNIVTISSFSRIQLFYFEAVVTGTVRKQRLTDSNTKSLYPLYLQQLGQPRGFKISIRQRVSWIGRYKLEEYAKNIGGVQDYFSCGKTEEPIAIVFAPKSLKTQLCVQKCFKNYKVQK